MWTEQNISEKCNDIIFQNIDAIFPAFFWDFAFQWEKEGK